MATEGIHEGRRTRTEDEQFEEGANHLNLHYKGTARSTNDAFIKAIEAKKRDL